MRNFLIKYTEYKALIFGDGEKKTGTGQGTTEKNAINDFIKHKRATGLIAVIDAVDHIPIKEPM